MPPKIGYLTYYEYISMSMSMINIGWQAGIQYGLNLGPYVKVIPYIDFMQDVIANSTMSMSGIYMDCTTQSYSLGPMPVAVMPGFDIVLRRLGLSLGGAYQTVKQESGENTRPPTFTCASRGNSGRYADCSLSFPCDPPCRLYDHSEADVRRAQL